MSITQDQKEQKVINQIQLRLDFLKENYTKPKEIGFYRAAAQVMKEGASVIESQIDKFKSVPPYVLDDLFALSQKMQDQAKETWIIRHGSRIILPKKLLPDYPGRLKNLERMLSIIAYVTILNVLEQFKKEGPYVLKQFIPQRLSWLTDFINQSKITTVIYLTSQPKKPRETFLKQIITDLYTNYGQDLPKGFPKQEALIELLRPHLK